MNNTGTFVFRKLLLVAFLMTALSLQFPQAAQAGGWWQTNSTDSIGSGFWETQDNNTSHTSPHGGFISSSNLCKTCHAVHMAGENSYRMLKSGNTTETRTQGETTVEGMGNSRSTECMYCHDATSGATDRKPYELSPLGHTVRGEHTLGATAIPDSNVNNPGQETGIFGRSDPATGQGAVLQCWQCHSVHGADTIGTTNAVEGNTYNGSDSVENWNSKILRLDPAGDGSVLAKGSGGLSPSVWQGELDTDGAAVRTGFCADCHNQNPNWEIDSDDTTRPNGRSHPQGPGTDSEMEVYGTTKTVAAHPLERLGCRGCHFATVGAAGTGGSRFPHQSVGWKLLFDEATMTGGSTDPLVLAGDPQRIIPKMDTICLSCHAVFEDIDKVAGTGLCLNCHASKYGAPNVKAQLDKQTTDSVSPGMGIRDITRDHSDEYGDPTAFSAPDNRHVECYDCHKASRIFPWEDDPLTGMWGVRVVSESFNTTPTLEVVPQVDIAKQEELCFKCHAYDNDAVASDWPIVQPLSRFYTDTNGNAIQQGNKAFEFNTNNTAYHPVRAVGRNQSNALAQQLAWASLSTTATLECTDCHNSDETSGTPGKASNSGFRPSGPHGSRYSPVIRGNYRTEYKVLPASFVPDNFGLCFTCHDQALLTAETGYATNFSDPGFVLKKRNLHRWHLVKLSQTFPTGAGYAEVAVCRRCHYNVHSNQAANNTSYYYDPGGDTWIGAQSYPIATVKTHLINFAPEEVVSNAAPKPAWLVDQDDSSRQCNLKCHVKQGVADTPVTMTYTYVPSDTDTLTY